MVRLAGSSSKEIERNRWIKMELALVLAEATGRRLGSIRQLRWEDIDLDHAQICWRADADKKGREVYQLTLGGSAENDAAIGDRLGPAIEKEEVADAIGKILDVYIECRQEEERFIDTYRRLGMAPFKERVYGGEKEEDKRVTASASH